MAEFPTDKYEVLALSYLQQQDLSGCSPEEYANKYVETENKIHDVLSRHASENIRRRESRNLSE